MGKKTLQIGAKGGRKIGRNGRRPGAARRKLTRPDLHRKFRNVIHSCGLDFACVWIKQRLDRKPPKLQDPPGILAHMERKLEDLRSGSKNRS